MNLKWHWIGQITICVKWCKQNYTNSYKKVSTLFHSAYHLAQFQFWIFFCLGSLKSAQVHLTTYLINKPARLTSLGTFFTLLVFYLSICFFLYVSILLAWYIGENLNYYLSVDVCASFRLSASVCVCLSASANFLMVAYIKEC